MQLPAIATKPERERFERLNIVFPILLAGWVPSILTLVVSYTILTNTLESKILRDRQTFVQLIGHLVGDDLSRTSGIIEYYQTLPDVGKFLTAPNAQVASQQWLASTFYSHPRIDGMFITGADGHLIASIPPNPNLIGKDFASELWRNEAGATREVYVSPVHPRFSDKRMTTDIVGAVRAPDGDGASDISAFQFWLNESAAAFPPLNSPINRFARWSIKKAMLFSSVTFNQTARPSRPPVKFCSTRSDQTRAVTSNAAATSIHLVRSSRPAG